MPLDGLDKIVANGQSLLDEQEPVEAHRNFNSWVSQTTQWLNGKFPNSGLSADWASQGGSNLVTGGCYYDDSGSWTIFRMTVDTRLSWLGNLPLKIRLSNLSIPAKTQDAAKQKGRKEIKLNTTSRAYVDPDRINDLKSITNKKFDLSKLIRLCEELNINFAGECYLGMIMITRAILDHIPPIFDCKNFAEVTNNYSGAKSFKQAMLHLEKSSRKIGDYYLHSQIRSSEALPNITQIDFSNDIDFLLSEITRISKQSEL